MRRVKFGPKSEVEIVPPELEVATSSIFLVLLRLNSGYVCCLPSWAISLESFMPFISSPGIDEFIPGGDGKAVKYHVDYCGFEDMDTRRYDDELQMRGKDRQELKFDETYEASVLEDLAEDFRLPIHHRPTENVDLDNVDQASLDRQLTSSNIGFRLLQKMGWKGKGLGKDEQGIVEPIKSGIRDAKLGLGKQEEDDYFTAEENIQRRKLDIEFEETEELARKREV
ncbi:G patch domain-containing protein 8 [Olea europaea subsp. europaea]|uniref:G patch domain-containing protein 8 n=1 Tax=Olea europaea subsp. europaea TaxID=158383 RepID=A0A8S0Q3Y9_OLEEU|nr:G patch domain-containing protein 8 [Olea europaea subsp. europaea]